MFTNYSFSVSGTGKILNIWSPLRSIGREDDLLNTFVINPLLNIFEQLNSHGPVNSPEQVGSPEPINSSALADSPQKKQTPRPLEGLRN